MESGGGLVNGGGTIEDRLSDGRLVVADNPIDDMLGVERDREGIVIGGAMVGRVSEGNLIEGALDVGSVKIEPGLPDGRLGAGIETEGRLVVGRLADSRPIVFALAEGPFSEGKVWLKG